MVNVLPFLGGLAIVLVGSRQVFLMFRDGSFRARGNRLIVRNAHPIAACGHYPKLRTGPPPNFNVIDHRTPPKRGVLRLAAFDISRPGHEIPRKPSLWEHQVEVLLLRAK